MTENQKPKVRFHYAWTRKQLAWFKRMGYPKGTTKFDGVAVGADGKFYYKDRPIIPKEDIEALLDKEYADATTGLKSQQAFFKHIQGKYAGISRARVERYLMGNEVYQKHRPAIQHTSIVRPITASRPYERLQIDLIDMQKIAGHNRGFHWGIDCD